MPLSARALYLCRDHSRGRATVQTESSVSDAKKSKHCRIGEPMDGWGGSNAPGKLHPIHLGTYFSCELNPYVHVRLSHGNRGQPTGCSNNKLAEHWRRNLALQFQCCCPCPVANSHRAVPPWLPHWPQQAPGLEGRDWPARPHSTQSAAAASAINIHTESEMNWPSSSWSSRVSVARVPSFPIDLHSVLGAVKPTTEPWKRRL